MVVSTQLIIEFVCTSELTMFLFRDRNKTFKPLKGHKRGTKRHELHVYSQKTLGSGDIRSAVALPKGEELNEWLAVNTVDFFNEINLLYGTVVEFCTPASCPVMKASDFFEYRWADGVNIKTPIKCPAPEYVDYLMTWVEGQFNDEAVFPTSVDVPFPRTFVSSVKTIFKRLFRVYAHIYHQHFDQIVSLEAEAHLNTCFKHFIFFVLEFKLIDKKELKPMQQLIDKFVAKEKLAQANKASRAAAAATAAASAAAVAASAAPAPAPRGVAASAPAPATAGAGGGASGGAPATATTTS